MSEKPILTIEAELPQISTSDVLAALSVARRQSGKGLFEMAKEMIGLARGYGKITPEEYVYYGLYEADHDEAQRRVYIGRKIERELHALTGDMMWWSMLHDKFVCYRVLASLGFRVPRTIAFYRHHAEFEGLPCLPDADSLASYLREQMQFPFFSKPVTGIRSAGIASCEKYDAGHDELVMADQRRLPVKQFVHALEGYAEDGYLFQERVSPHPDIADVCGDRLATARIIVVIEAEGSGILETLWKIPTGANLADNYWREGNLLAAVDAQTGKVLRVISGYGLERREVEIHPDTSGQLVGFRLPDWKEAKDVCLRAAAAFPRLRMQAFDVALSNQGPLLMEVNVGGDYNLPQLATRKGMLTHRFCEFLRYCARKQNNPAELRRLETCPGSTASRKKSEIV